MNRYVNKYGAGLKLKAIIKNENSQDVKLIEICL